MRCHSCELVRINGVVCHETGCPEAFKSERRECRWCGAEFTPEERFQRDCCESCRCAYYGVPDDDGWAEQDQLDLESQCAE